MICSILRPVAEASSVCFSVMALARSSPSTRPSPSTWISETVTLWGVGGEGGVSVCVCVGGGVWCVCVCVCVWFMYQIVDCIAS